MDSIYAAMDGGEVRSANLQTFFQLAADYETGNHRDLGQFLDHLKAMEAKGLISAGSAAAGCVTIMSIHKSKGLEFPVVFLCGLSRKFNRDSLQARILADKGLGLGLSVVDPGKRMRYPTIAKKAIAVKMAAESLSEELRVLYVAMTRARDRLIMTYIAQNLENKLKDIALRADFDNGSLLCRDVSCPGDWVLLTALHKTEANALFALGDKPKHTAMSCYPWHVEVPRMPDKAAGVETGTQTGKQMPPEAEEQIRQALSFAYPHTAATQAPSKQTATGRKGRIKDEEAAEDTVEAADSLHRTWRRPSFLEPEKSGKTYGNAMHGCMQYVNYANCTDTTAVEQEIRRLVQEGFLSREQGEMVSPEEIAAFFETEEGSKLRSGTCHIREFKFSILDNAQHYGDGLQGEKVLLQGVVDCALLEEDGITVIDFKTDRVSEETLDAVANRYRIQVKTYGEALSRIYEKPIKGRKLWFFRLRRFVEV